MSDDYKKGKKIRGRKRRDEEDEFDDIDEEIDEEIQYHNHSSDSESESSDEDIDEEIDEEIDEAISEPIKSKHSEVKIDISTLALDKSAKSRLESGFKSDILIFEMQSVIGNLGEGVIELRSDEPFRPNSKGHNAFKSARESHEISDIQSISLLSVQNTYPVSIAANVNGLKDQNAATYRKNGVTAHIIANSADSEVLTKPRLIICPTTKKVDLFLEKYPDLSIDKISKGSVETNGLCLLEKESPLLDFISNEMKIKAKPVNEKLFAVDGKHGKEAINQIEKRLECKNMCDLRDITLNVEAAWPKSDAHASAIEQLSEIESYFPAQRVEEVKRDARTKMGKFRVALQVIHRPLSNQ